MLTFRDGTKASGELHSFERDAAQLKLQPNGGSGPVSIPFSILLKLYFPRPLAPKRRPRRRLKRR